MFRKLQSKMVLAIILASALPASALSSDRASGHLLGGSLNSPIRLEIFSDFQCSHCRDFYLMTIRRILEEYSSKDLVCVIYHEFPLSTNRYSLEAARFSEAVSRLGRQKLLPLYDSLFVTQPQWSRDGNLEEAVSKVLSSEDFQKVKRLLNDPSVNLAIDKEIELSREKGIHSTPTSIIYYTGKEQKVEGVVTYLVLKQFINSILK
jgi:protein-disulfide isomerase